MKSALQVILTTRRGIIVFMAHVTILDATAAYPNHIGHSVCLRNSIPLSRSMFASAQMPATSTESSG